MCTKTKSTSQVRIKPETFVNFMPEPDPKSPARLTTLGRTDVEDDERSRRPTASKSTNNIREIEKIVREDRRLSIRLIADRGCPLTKKQRGK